MPTEKELLALCLRWIENPQGDAFDKAMLIEAIKAKLKPEREWVGLTDEEIKALPQWYPSHETAAALPLIRAVEAKLKQRNT